ncbi:MAG: hypothetical protein NUV97_01405 [archaeon]|nr:hypothetical protein [archaeon]
MKRRLFCVHVVCDSPECNNEASFYSLISFKDCEIEAAKGKWVLTEEEALCSLHRHRSSLIKERQQIHGME